MSLIVAKKEGGNIYIVSDTKLTNPENLNRVEMVAPEEFSAIKIIIINPHISIAFAGEISYAKDAIAFCRNCNPDTGAFGDPTVLKKFGDVPDDLSTL